MRKKLSALLALGLLVTVVGCGGGGETAAESDDKAVENPKEEAPTTTATLSQAQWAFEARFGAMPEEMKQNFDGESSAEVAARICADTAELTYVGTIGVEHYPDVARAGYAWKCPDRVEPHDAAVLAAIAEAARLREGGQPKEPPTADKDPSPQRIAPAPAPAPAPSPAPTAPPAPQLVSIGGEYRLRWFLSADLVDGNANCSVIVPDYRVQIKDAAGAILYVATPSLVREEERTQDSLSTSFLCVSTYSAQVPASAAYTVVVVSSSDAARALDTQTVNGATGGSIAGPNLWAFFGCVTGGGGCGYR